MSMWDPAADFREQARALGLDLSFLQPMLVAPPLCASPGEPWSGAAGTAEGSPSVVTDAVSAGKCNAGARKRKAAPAAAAAAAQAPAAARAGERVSSSAVHGAKRCRAAEDSCGGGEENDGLKEERCGCESSVEDGGTRLEKESTPAVPPKDYIHVRAKRGQATDSHSLAERVRRERISQRMKILQDLVPGCKNVTGKALMLDEIINYVQSLQRQVEFLSMKLSTVCPQLECNKLQEMHCFPMMLNSFFPLEASGAISMLNEQYAHQNVPFHSPFANSVVDSAIFQRASKQLAFHDGLPSSSSQANMLADDFHGVLSIENKQLQGAEIADCNSQGW